MVPTPTAIRNDTATDDLGDPLASWRRHMTAQRMSPATLSTYSTSVGQLTSFLAARRVLSPVDRMANHR